jgi:DMSO reductase anchor subunit
METQWALVLFTVIAGTGAWLFAASTLGWLAKRGDAPTKLECILSFVLLVVGGCTSMLHLKHVDRILEALNHPTSGIFVEAALVGIMCAIVAVYFIMMMRGTGEKAKKVVAGLGMVVGIIFSYACGSSYLMEARAAWMTYALPLSYCTTVAVAGTALNMLCKVIEKKADEHVSFAGAVEAVMSVLAIVCCIVFLVHARDSISGTEAIAWLVALFAALIVGVAGGVKAYKSPSGTMTLAIVLVVLGVVAAIALRVLMWQTGTPLLNFFMMPMD